MNDYRLANVLTQAGYRVDICGHYLAVYGAKQQWLCNLSWYEERGLHFHSGYAVKEVREEISALVAQALLLREG